MQKKGARGGSSGYTRAIFDGIEIWRVSGDSWTAKQNRNLSEHAQCFFGPVALTERRGKAGSDLIVGDCTNVEW